MIKFYINNMKLISQYLSLPFSTELVMTGFVCMNMKCDKLPVMREMRQLVTYIHYLIFFPFLFNKSNSRCMHMHYFSYDQIKYFPLVFTYFNLLFFSFSFFFFFGCLFFLVKCLEKIRKG